MSEFVMYKVKVALDPDLQVPIACTLEYGRLSSPGSLSWDQCVETYTRTFVDGAYVMGVACTREVNYANGSRELARKTQSYAMGASAPWHAKGSPTPVPTGIADPWAPDDARMVFSPFKLRTRARPFYGTPDLNIHK